MKHNPLDISAENFYMRGRRLHGTFEREVAEAMHFKKKNPRCSVNSE